MWCNGGVVGCTGGVVGTNPPSVLMQITPVPVSK